MNYPVITNLTDGSLEYFTLYDKQEGPGIIYLSLELIDALSRSHQRYLNCKAVGRIALA